MDIEQFFEHEKGITIDAARNSNARYTAIDMAKFAKKFYAQNELKDKTELFIRFAKHLLPSGYTELALKNITNDFLKEQEL